jgi:hypothetical protein
MIATAFLVDRSPLCPFLLKIPVGPAIDSNARRTSAACPATLRVFLSGQNDHRAAIQKLVLGPIELATLLRIGTPGKIRTYDLLLRRSNLTGRTNQTCYKSNRTRIMTVGETLQQVLTASYGVCE